MTLLICLFPIDYTTSAVYRTHDEVNICVVLKTLTTDVFANTNEKKDLESSLALQKKS